jgi:bifunctional UDP-N-acetylglucosamine pyrophosphorylase/glucosamine-1-phosphate N-acetyltransferase
MNQLSAIILAAGKGTRMSSDLPKVAHEVAGKAMVRWVAEACAVAGCTRIVLVVGHGQEIVRSLFDDWAYDEARIEFAVQEPQLGTGHAVQCAEPLFGDDPRGDVFVLAGDGPLIRPETLETLHARHRESGATATLATALLDDPAGYGRIVRDRDGRFIAIVEHKNCTDAQRTIREINPSYYCFDASALFGRDGALARVTRDEKSGEYFLTDAVGLLAGAGDGRGVEVIEAVPAEDVLSINTPEQLAEVDQILRTREGAAGVRGGSA